MSSRLRRLALDLRPLRVSRDFRRLWFGLLVSSAGSMFSLVAVFIQVTRLTGSTVAVGATGVVWLLGLIVGTLVGGPVLDAVDRRRLLAIAQLGLASGITVLLAGAVIGDPPLWLIYLGIVIIAGFNAIDGPTRSAMTPRLIGADLIPSAQALNQVVWNGAALIGPAIAGILIQRVGLTWAYAIDLGSITIMLGAALSIRPLPPEGTEGNATGFGAVREGFAFVRDNRLIRSTFIIDLVAMIFGLPRALFTFLAIDQYGGGDGVVGLLFAAPAVGALIGAIASGWTHRVVRQGRAVVIAVALWGVAIVVFGWSDSHLWIGLVALALAGWADVISAIFRGTILQLAVPDRLRGRLSGIHILVVTGGPRLGDLEAGLVAAAVSPAFSVVSGGLACILGAWLVSLRYPELLGYRSDARNPSPT